MAIGYFIGIGDKTSCGGKVLDYWCPDTWRGSIACGLVVVGTRAALSGGAAGKLGEIFGDRVYKAAQ